MSYRALYSDCEECNLRHVKMTEKVYIVWFSALPFACRHKKAVHTLRGELDAEVATQQPLAILPDRISALRPPNATDTTGGPTSLAKLKKDMERLKKTASTAEQELLDVLSTVWKHPQVHSQFPEFKTEILEDMIADIINDCDGTEASL